MLEQELLELAHVDPADEFVFAVMQLVQHIHCQMR